jgi:hypothetical protein
MFPYCRKRGQPDALVGTGIFQMHSADECASVVFITFNADDVADASHMRKGIASSFYQ